MKRARVFILSFILLLAFAGVFAKYFQEDDRFITYIADPRKQDIHLYWKDDKSENLRSIQNLRSWLDKRDEMLVFAMNGGMYKPDNSPQAFILRIEKFYLPLIHLQAVVIST